LHTLSNVSYLAKIRNKTEGSAIVGLEKEEHIAAHGTEHKAEGGETHKKETTTEAHGAAH
jgi:hypothetical protein